MKVISLHLVETNEWENKRANVALVSAVYGKMKSQNVSTQSWRHNEGHVRTWYERWKEPLPQLDDIFPYICKTVFLHLIFCEEMCCHTRLLGNSQMSNGRRRDVRARKSGRMREKVKEKTTSHEKCFLFRDTLNHIYYFRFYVNTEQGYFLRSLGIGIGNNERCGIANVLSLKSFQIKCQRKINVIVTLTQANNDGNDGDYDDAIECWMLLCFQCHFLI